ncbi:MAG TPA: phosphoenolpyruvate carboxylase, partial [Ktedonobacteraceae bacterium]|nr:phosphoenolpyruvate carboxylase [Ktedonobacteraceae bacterium]
MMAQDKRGERDALLRQDIRTLGDALGRAIQRYGGSAVFETVERLRRNCKRLRDCAERLSQALPEEALQLHSEIDDLDREIMQVVESCDLDTAIDVIRAFTIYFHLVNTAEQYQRIRRRKLYELSDANQPQRGSLAALSDFLQQNNVEAATVQQLLNQLSIELVFTAHPTEATRRSLITKSRRIAQLLEMHDHEDALTPRQRLRWQRDLDGIIDLLWRTD